MQIRWRYGLQIRFLFFLYNAYFFTKILLFYHLLESSHRDDSNKWSKIGFGEEITQVESIEFTGALDVTLYNWTPVGNRTCLYFLGHLQILDASPENMSSNCIQTVISTADLSLLCLNTQEKHTFLLPSLS